MSGAREAAARLVRVALEAGALAAEVTTNGGGRHGTVLLITLPGRTVRFPLSSKIRGGRGWRNMPNTEASLRRLIRERMQQCQTK